MTTYMMDENVKSLMDEVRTWVLSYSMISEMLNAIENNTVIKKGCIEILMNQPFIKDHHLSRDCDVQTLRRISQEALDMMLTRLVLIAMEHYKTIYKYDTYRANVIKFREGIIKTLERICDGETDKRMISALIEALKTYPFEF